MAKRSKSRRVKLVLPPVAVAKQEQGVILRARMNVSVPVPTTAPLKQLSRYWTYVLSNRLRVTDESRPNIQKRALNDLENLGVSPEQIQTLAGTNILEVDAIHFRAGGLGVS